MSEQQPADTEDAARAALAVAKADNLVMRVLRDVVAPYSYERAFLSRDAAGFDVEDRRLLGRLAWHYRGKLPRHLAPKLPPDDPIVREMEAAHG